MVRKRTILHLNWLPYSFLCSSMETYSYMLYFVNLYIFIYLFTFALSVAVTCNVLFSSNGVKC